MCLIDKRTHNVEHRRGSDSVADASEIIQFLDRSSHQIPMHSLTHNRTKREQWIKPLHKSDVRKAEALNRKLWSRILPLGCERDPPNNRCPCAILSRQRAPFPIASRVDVRRNNNETPRDGSASDMFAGATCRARLSTKYVQMICAPRMIAHRQPQQQQRYTTPRKATATRLQTNI